MRISAEKREEIKRAIEPFDTENNRSVAVALEYNDKTYRWALFHAANKASGYELSSDADGTFDDSHITTALGKIVEPLR